MHVPTMDYLLLGQDFYFYPPGTLPCRPWPSLSPPPPLPLRCKKNQAGVSGEVVSKPASPVSRSVGRTGWHKEKARTISSNGDDEIFDHAHGCRGGQTHIHTIMLHTRGPTGRVAKPGAVSAETICFEHAQRRLTGRGPLRGGGRKGRRRAVCLRSSHTRRRGGGASGRVCYECR